MSNRLFNDSEFDAMFNSTQKTVKRTFAAIIVLWVLGVIISLGATGVLIWAIIKLVNHLTA